MKIMRLLREQGAELVYHDDHVPEVSELRLASEPLESALEGCDAAVIVTAHPELDVRTVVESAPLVVDFHGVTRGIQAEHLVRL